MSNWCPNGIQKRWEVTSFVISPSSHKILRNRLTAFQWRNIEKPFGLKMHLRFMQFNVLSNAVTWTEVSFLFNFITWIILWNVHFRVTLTFQRTHTQVLASWCLLSSGSRIPHQSVPQDKERHLGRRKRMETVIKPFPDAEHWSLQRDD